MNKQEKTKDIEQPEKNLFRLSNKMMVYVCAYFKVMAELANLV